MKKITIIVLCMCVVALMVGMLIPYSHMPEGITFYYERTNYQYGEESGVIGSEFRPISGHERNLEYLLALYMEGPLSEALVPSFPDEVQILRIEESHRQLLIELNEFEMSDAHYTLACACLAKTCFTLTDAKSVVIISGARSIKMTQKNVMIYDGSSSAEEPKTEEQR